MFLLVAASSRAIDLYKHGPPSKSVAQLSCLFATLIPLPLSGSVFPTNEIFPK